MLQRKELLAFLGTWLLAVVSNVAAHEAKDFDDAVLYKIDFEMPDFELNPELKNQVKIFHTHEAEQYSCVIPVVESGKEEKKANELEFSPFALLQPLFKAPSCSYRIEAYWSYEICHGHHVRQYHEEREGKNVKFQEYYLGKWNEEKTEVLDKAEKEDNREPGVKYKTIKIDNTKYRYFEMEMSDGTLCDIVNAPRTTIVRYVCYPHGKNEIYSFKETSSCVYEAIILTSELCMIPAFHPEESKEVSIKCFNSLTETHKPLSMLRQDLYELQLSSNDFPVSKDSDVAATNAWFHREAFVHKDIEKYVLELMPGAKVTTETLTQQQSNLVPESVANEKTAEAMPLTDLTAVKEFISGRNCLIGGTGWWKYEFCYGRHVRQFHKDKTSENELFLGYFTESTHWQWVSDNPDKGIKRDDFSASLWHHYDQGTRCDRTGLPREVDVKLTCTPIANSATAVSMYLLEPKTCQYILVVESPIVCDLIKLSDEYGLVQAKKLQLLILRSYELQVDNAKEKTSESSEARGSISDTLPHEEV